MSKLARFKMDLLFYALLFFCALLMLRGVSSFKLGRVLTCGCDNVEPCELPSDLAVEVNKSFLQPCETVKTDTVMPRAEFFIGLVGFVFFAWLHNSVKKEGGVSE